MKTRKDQFLKPLAFLKPLGSARLELPYSRMFNGEQRALLQEGIWPRKGDEHWVIRLDKHSLNVWIRWSGHCIYSLPAIFSDDDVTTGPLLVNVNPLEHHIPYTDPKQAAPYLEKFRSLHISYINELLDSALFPDDSRLLTDDERQNLCNLLQYALVIIRGLGSPEKAEQASRLADALHNVPSLLWSERFSFRLLRLCLENYCVKYADQNLLEMLDEIIDKKD